MEVRIEDKTVLRRMMELYQYDMSEREERDLNEHGIFGYPYLDHYWTESDRHPFVVRVNNQLAGFALVNRHCYSEGRDYALAEFFVLRRYRRQGVGVRMARLVFDRLPGAWEVAVSDNNAEALAFWERVIAGYTRGRYRVVRPERAVWAGPLYTFENK